MKLIGCSTPFSLGDPNTVCQDSNTSTIALELYDQYLVQHNHSNTCPHSCTKTLMHYNVKKENKEKEIRINFPRQIKRFTSYYSYELLSMLAEIGGYIGLLLGVSLLDCLTIWTNFFKQ